MLKIKDNVDLKELEKFGFKYCEEDYTEETDAEPYINKYWSSYEKKKSDYPIYINVSTRIIDDQYINPPYAEVVPADLIYDLIKADLVEKVGD